MGIFHSIVAKLLFVGKWARPDIIITIAFLTTRVSKSDEDDWKKLERLMCYIKGTFGFEVDVIGRFDEYRGMVGGRFIWGSS